MPRPTDNAPLDIAIVGAGISGLVAARELHGDHAITVYEGNDYIGGHTNTLDVEHEGVHYAVDTGFIVFNDWTYPNFIRMLGELGVEYQASDMSFSVSCERTGLEYCGSSLNQLFCQRRNVVSPRFHRMVFDILRFNKASLELLASPEDQTSLGEYLEANRYSQRFIEHYIIPMGAAIWSADPEMMYRFPARYFVEFFSNHGMLQIRGRPQWRVVKGGSREYVKPLIAPFADRIRTATPVLGARRDADGVTLTLPGGHTARHDAVVFACHSDQALQMLQDPSPAEREILSAIPYQVNETVLHTDERLLPKRRAAWAAWNYHIPATTRDTVAVTYNMNILQTLDAPVQFCVTLNHVEDIDPAKVIRHITYAHPVYTPEGVAAQKRREEISGANRSFFCGAWWSYGFHEDGVKSGLAAADAVRTWSGHEELPLRRAG